MTETHSENASPKPDVVQVADLGRDLLVQAREHHSRRAAKTLLSGTSMRATVIALAQGAELAEHDSPPAATLQVLTGRIRLYAGDHEWLLEEGQVVPIPPVRHGLVALEDCVVLLTVALH
jgi:quercetin dioxygenase-like cupin family protein